MIQKEMLILAALLHDIGKFWQRAGRKGSHQEAGIAFIDKFKKLFPYEWLDDLCDAVGNHHAGYVKKEIEKVIRVADWLSARERMIEPRLARQDPDKTPLLPVVSRVKFRYESTGEHLRYQLNKLDLKRDGIFPLSNVTISSANYENLWNLFVQELAEFDTLTNTTTLTSFLFLLRKFTSFMPAATPWEEDEEHRILPDISLFDHLKVTAGIALCLNRLYPDHLDELHHRDLQVQVKPVSYLWRGDISGIQNFIYRITRPEAEPKGTAKRLRGRCFFLTLLTEVIADWLIRELDLSIVNILFCGGGRFDLLIGVDELTKEKLRERENTLQKWLMENFYGELGIQTARIELAPKDFEDMKEIYTALESELAYKKEKKFEEFVTGKLSLDRSSFFTPKEQLYQVCEVCRLTPLREEGICQFCQIQSALGNNLPKADYIGFIYGNVNGLVLPKEGSVNYQDLFKVTVVLLDEEERRNLISSAQKKDGPIIIFRLNSTNFMPKESQLRNVAYGFKFLANMVPVALENFSKIKLEKEPIKKSEVLDFEEIAYLSEGAKLLGVLKADVDYLGSIFSLGIETMSISRLSTLSSSFDLFFTGYLNEICKQVSQKWKESLSEKDKRRELVEQVFYIVYSGGDDLVIIGPWDQIVELAGQLYSDFRAYTSQNPNITLSAGILLVKPHFPIQRFAQLVTEELERSKKDNDKKEDRKLREKDRVTIFRETVKWKNSAKSFDELIKFGKALAKQVEDRENPLPKSFVYFLKQLYDQHFKADGISLPMWIPKFHYALARRVKKEVIENVELNLLGNVPAMIQKIIIPLSYASLKTRKE